MAAILLSDLTQLIAAANAARGWRDGAPDARMPNAAAAEQRLEALFGVHCALAVYGTLAPGRPNHHVVAPLGGGWSDGVVEGELSAEGWGATFGYPAFRPRAGGAAVAVKVLSSPALAAAWAALDEFEGAEYRRILVPVLRSGRAGERAFDTVANIYAAATDAPGSPDRTAR
jgi:gamma-glutamylcyclotransferase (GGCT)/AIG2-like uncharacterized protein YtfP